MEVTDSETGELINGAAAMNRFGEYELRDRIPPGVVDVRVRSRGYQDGLIRHVLLTEPGRRVDLSVALKPDPTVGDLEVVVPSMRDRVETADGVGQPMPRMLLRRAGAPGGEWDLVTDLQAVPGVPTYRLLAIPEGTYDALVCDLDALTAAVLRGVTVRRGEVEIVTADLQRGRMVPLHDLVSDAPRLSVLHIRTLDGAELPMYRARGATVSTFALGEPVDSGLVLGPYPDVPVTLSVVTASGALREVRLSATSDGH